MAVHKATRSNLLAQLQAKPKRRRPNPQLHHSQIKDQRIQDPQLKSQFLETLRHMNRGFGVVLAAFDKLQRQDRLVKPGIFLMPS